MLQLVRKSIGIGFTIIATARHKVYGDTKVYITVRNTVVTVLKAGRDVEILSSNHIGEDIGALPTISNGRFQRRSNAALDAIQSQQ